MKKCSKCKLEFPLTEFSKDRSRKDGYKYNCKSCARSIQTASRNKKPDYYKNKSKIYFDQNREYFYQKTKEWNSKNPEKVKKWQREWREKNPKYANEWQKNERKNNPQYRIKFNLRERMRKALKGNWKQGKTVELLGLSILEYKEYLSKQFDENMTWDNYGVYWEIDHIKPCSSFDLTNLEEQKECFIFTNTQPMIISDNRRKSNKIIQ
tara:strand:+ start:100 stop:726 length:627 start_codon:yes stop_codon:yes gene_type:complete